MHCRKVVKVQEHAIGKLMVEVYPIMVLVQLVFSDNPDDDKIHYEVSRDDTVGKSRDSYRGMGNLGFPPPQTSVSPPKIVWVKLIKGLILAVFHCCSL